MDITPETLVYHELIGLHIEVESETYAVKGVVSDETKNMLVIRKGDRDVKVPKACCAFVFTLPDGRRVRVDGTLLASRPEDRIPKKKRR
jgi:ribonuclease P protein subunit POP4